VTNDPEYQRRYYQENRDKILAVNRAYVANNREQVRRQKSAWYRQNQDRLISEDRWRRHGMSPETWAELWDKQDGRCYLCGHEMAAADARVDHDHSCCPKERSCSVCWRGLAHNQCNMAIGIADESPDQLRRMADALEAAQMAFRERLAASGTEQLTLDS
jgi:hypothetical protein